MVTTDALAEDLRADVLNLVSLWADAYAHKTNEKERWIKMADAIDTLAHYHRDKGAVEALEEMRNESCSARPDYEGCAEYYKSHKQTLGEFRFIECRSCKALAAAKEKLVAYEER